MIQTYNFRINASSIDVEGIGVEKNLFDNRNGIYCKNATMDMRCYYNYIVFLNSVRGSWESFGYLDLGMVPIIMLPSFYGADAAEALTRVLKGGDLKLYSRPSVSVMRDGKKQAVDDQWAFRDELAEYLGITNKKVSTLDFLRRYL